MLKKFLINLFPISKIFLVLSLIFSAIIFLDYRYNYLLILLFLISSIITNKLRSFLKRLIIIIIPMWTSIFLFQSIFMKQGDKVYKILFFNVYHDGIIRAFRITSILTVFIAGMTFLSLIIDVKKLSIALEQKGVSPKVIYLLISSINMIDDFQKRGKLILESQQTRGIEIKGNIFRRIFLVFPIFIPLTLSSLTSAEERAIALESRGFLIGTKKTLLQKIEIKKVDRIVNLLSIFIVVLSITFKIILIFRR